MLARAWSDARGSLVGAFDGEELDASLLLLPELGFLPADDPRFVATLAAIERELRRGDYLYRYSVDEFGEATTVVQRLHVLVHRRARAGRAARRGARAVREHARRSATPPGLLSEDLDAKTGELWGNIPQTYSMVGLINSAMRLSKRWEEAL